MAEGKTTRIRVLGPKYLAYEADDEQSLSTNYTLTGTPSQNVTIQRGPNSFVGIPIDIEFGHGLKFADIVSVNFTMTVDKNQQRPVGSGRSETAVVFHPLCKQNVFSSYPANDNTYVSCGTLTSRPFFSDAPGKYFVLSSGNLVVHMHIIVAII